MTNFPSEGSLFVDWNWKGGFRMNIYVGNLAKDVTEDVLRGLFEAFGQVTSVTILKDRFTNEPRGFAFVEMPDEEQAKAAINGLNKKQVNGQYLNVNEARPRTDSRDNKGRKPFRRY